MLLKDAAKGVGVWQTLVFGDFAFFEPFILIKTSKYAYKMTKYI